MGIDASFAREISRLNICNHEYVTCWRSMVLLLECQYLLGGSWSYCVNRYIPYCVGGMAHALTLWTIAISAWWSTILMFKPLQSLLHWRDGSRSYLVNHYNPYCTGGMDQDRTPCEPLQSLLHWRDGSRSYTLWTVTILIALAGWITILPCEPLQSLCHWRDGSRSYLVNRHNASGPGHDSLWTVRIQSGWDIILVSAVPPVFARSPWCSLVRGCIGVMAASHWCPEDGHRNVRSGTWREICWTLELSSESLSFFPPPFLASCQLVLRPVLQM